MDISCHLSNGIQQYDCREVKTCAGMRVSPEKENSLCILQNLYLYYKHLYGLAKKKKAEGHIFNFWVCNGTIHVRKLQDSPMIDNTHKSDV